MEHVYDPPREVQETPEPIEDQDHDRCPECGHELDLPPPPTIRALGSIGTGIDMPTRVRSARRETSPIVVPIERSKPIDRANELVRIGQEIRKKRMRPARGFRRKVYPLGRPGFSTGESYSNP